MENFVGYIAAAVVAGFALGHLLSPVVHRQAPARKVSPAPRVDDAWLGCIVFCAPPCREPSAFYAVDVVTAEGVTISQQVAVKYLRCRTWPTGPERVPGQVLVQAFSAFATDACPQVQLPGLTDRRSCLNTIPVQRAKLVPVDNS